MKQWLNLYKKHKRENGGKESANIKNIYVEERKIGGKENKAEKEEKCY
jgi:hypothetical protein